MHTFAVSPRRRLHLVAADTQPSPAKQRQIFEPFSQADTSTTRNTAARVWALPSPCAWWR